MNIANKQQQLERKFRVPGRNKRDLGGFDFGWKMDLVEEKCVAMNARSD